MALFDVGRVCRKTRGRDAGAFVVITCKDKDALKVQSADGKDLKVSGAHLEPTAWVVEGKDAAKELKALELA